ncbi:hypothetical protein BAXH7_00522 [Bacillus amyloliquefaciens XH7]|nr:hypothetical protein BAMTA208_02490 [Bacillus amyloliquefaciens TA208]AEB62061.1 hypothetical protein LL3_00513 [Bacillus amyloliquefaciens LL3]AEK87668.1 hypothetical protein BAXH7_00522 [Bacillus amyloliquefaciens XH7]KYC93136.1 hypothetical protein B425_0505 [Bacillus amyloliquefaciens]
MVFLFSADFIRIFLGKYKKPTIERNESNLIFIYPFFSLTFSLQTFKV